MRNLLLRALGATALLVLVSTGPASAHAGLVGTDPSDGASLTAMPTSVSLTFNENIGNPAYVAVTAPDGTQLDVTDTQAVDAEVRARVADPGQRGTYTMAYRVVSADGHPVGGTVTFDVTQGKVVEQVQASGQQSFVHRHREHIAWGVGAAVVAVVLLVLPLRRRRG